MQTFSSDISNIDFPTNEKVIGKSISPSLFQYIQKDKPHFTADKCLSSSELNFYREKYIAEYLVNEIGELNELEKTVLTSFTSNTTLADKIDDGDDHERFTTGQKIADKVAAFGGSWKFIILFGLFILIWICINIFWVANKGFDPYPFILLNLILSCLAALQAPVIMMSQNRQEEKDRERAKKDYMINLKSELEIRILHEKIDHLIMHQQQELLEIQKVQIDLMQSILKQVSNKT